MTSSTAKLPVGRTLQCKRCGYGWVTTLVGRLPNMCPNPECFSTYWNVDKEYLPKPRKRRKK